MKIIWPEGRAAAFSFIDDTDDAVMPDIKVVYNFLWANNILGTKTVWVYPPRDVGVSFGDCLAGSDAYREFILDLQRRGYEIALHNVGSGGYRRQEILAGLEYFRQTLGQYPRIHINHSYNADNIYCGPARFSFPLNALVARLYPNYKGFLGDVEGSEYFWGDIHKQRITYSRNYELDDLNVIKHMRIPYRDKQYAQFANYIFPSCFASNQWLMAKRLRPVHIDRLVAEGGCAIIYTHFGYYLQKGALDREFVEAVEALGRRKDIWFAPVSTILDYLIRTGQDGGEIGWWTKKTVEMKSLWTRIKYRYVERIDDAHYKKSLRAQESPLC